MDLKLRVLEGKNAGREIPVPNNKFLIGRAEDCHLRPGSDLISRHHCVILVDEGYIGVRDFGSKNGTYVNDERVSGERELKAGDRLAIGPLKFEIHVAHGLAAKKRPPVNDVKEAAARTAQDAQQDPFDVNSWLDSAADAETAAVKDTTGVHASDTETIDVSTTQTFTPDAPEEEEEAKPAHGKKAPASCRRFPNRPRTASRPRPTR